LSSAAEILIVKGVKDRLPIVVVGGIDENQIAYGVGFN
jgi:hypothetical protein